MTRSTLMNWEVFLDAAGFCCCVLTVLYLIKLKRTASFRGRISDYPIQQEDISPFTATPIDLTADMSFDGVFASVNNDCRLAVTEGGRGRAAADPYDEVRRLLDMGMEAHQIAERTKIPQCEINLIVSLRQIQTSAVSGETTENEYGSILV
jgi:hypothetical protein